VGRKRKQTFACRRQLPLIHPLESRTLFASISNVFVDFFTGLRTVSLNGDGTNETYTINHNGNGRVEISGPSPPYAPTSSSSTSERTAASTPCGTT